MSAHTQSSAQTPDRRRVTRIQAQRLSQLADVPFKEIEGRSIAELSDSLKWQIDPELLLFRRVCGQVVRWDLRAALPAGAVRHRARDGYRLRFPGLLPVPERSYHGFIRFGATRKRSPASSPMNAASSASGCPGSTSTG